MTVSQSSKGTLYRLRRCTKFSCQPFDVVRRVSLVPKTLTTDTAVRLNTDCSNKL